jgi:hypothetical protein
MYIYIQGGSKKYPTRKIAISQQPMEIFFVTKIPDFTGKRLYYKH